MEREVRRYADAYGQRCIAVRNTFDNQWKLTLLTPVGDTTVPVTRLCRTVGEMKLAMRQWGWQWKEVDRWRATTLTG